MAFCYQIYRQHALGIVRLTGSVSGRDVLDAMDALFGDARWQPGYSALWDAYNIDALVMLPAEANAIMDRSGELRERIGGGKAALVTQRDMDRAIAVMLTHRRKSRPERNVRVFHRLCDAEEWLQLDVQLEPLVEQVAAS